MIGFIILCVLAAAVILWWVEHDSQRQALLDEMVLDRRHVSAKYMKYLKAHQAYYIEGRYSIEYVYQAEKELKDFIQYYNQKYRKYTDGINIDELLIEEW